MRQTSIRLLALIKLSALVLLVVVFNLILGELADNGIDVGRLRALTAVAIMLSFVPLLELILGAPFLELSARWNLLASWQQWGIVLLVLVGLFAMFVAITATLAGKH